MKREDPKCPKCPICGEEEHELDILGEAVQNHLRKFGMEIETYTDSSGEKYLRMIIGRKGT